MRYWLLSVCLLFGISTSPGLSIPVNFQYSGTQLLDIPLLSTPPLGTPFTIDFVLDNGGASLQSQIYDIGDLISFAILSADGIVNTNGIAADVLTIPILPVLNITTDAVGNIATADWGFHFNSSMSGSESVFGNVSGVVSYINSDFTTRLIGELPTPTNTSISLLPDISLPATSTLLLAGLGILIFINLFRGGTLKKFTG